MERQYSTGPKAATQSTNRRNGRSQVNVATRALKALRNHGIDFGRQTLISVIWDARRSQPVAPDDCQRSARSAQSSGWFRISCTVNSMWWLTHH